MNQQVYLAKWRWKKSLLLTRERRPDLFLKLELNKLDRKPLENE